MRTTFRFEWDNSELALTDEGVRVYNILATMDYSKDETITIDEIQLDIRLDKQNVFLDSLTIDEQKALKDYASEKADWLIWNGCL